MQRLESGKELKVILRKIRKIPFLRYWNPERNWKLNFSDYRYRLTGCTGIRKGIESSVAHIVNPTQAIDTGIRKGIESQSPNRLGLACHSSIWNPERNWKLSKRNSWATVGESFWNPERNWKLISEIWSWSASWRNWNPERNWKL